MLDHGKIVLNALRSRVNGTIFVRAVYLGPVLFPVRSVHNVNVVLHEPLPVLIVVKVQEVFLVR